MSFVIYSCETGKCWNQNIFTNLQNFVKVWKNSENTPNIAKINRVFSGKGRGDRALILTYLDSPVAVVFPHYWISFSISVIFRGKRVVKVGPKVQTLGRFFFMKIQILRIFFKQCFCLLEYYWWEFWQYWTIFGAVRAQKSPKKGHFMDTESVRKTLKTT